MKSYKTQILLVLLSLCWSESKAQWYDYGEAARQIQMQQSQMLNEYTQQALKLLEQSIQQQQKNFSASTLFIPGQVEDRYGAFIALSYIGGESRIKIKYGDNEYDSHLIRLSECYVIGQYIILPGILKPGYELTVSDTSTDKILFEEKIPLKSSSSYNSFAAKARNNVSIISALNGGSGSSGKNSSSSSSGKYAVTCRSCNGTGVCGTCKGNGTYLNGYTGDYIACPNCVKSNGRICSVCNGTGKWSFNK